MQTDIVKSAVFRSCLNPLDHGFAAALLGNQDDLGLRSVLEGEARHDFQSSADLHWLGALGYGVQFKSINAAARDDGAFKNRDRPQKSGGHRREQLAKLCGTGQTSRQNGGIGPKGGKVLLLLCSSSARLVLREVSVMPAMQQNIHAEAALVTLQSWPCSCVRSASFVLSYSSQASVAASDAS